MTVLTTVKIRSLKTAYEGKVPENGCFESKLACRSKQAFEGQGTTNKLACEFVLVIAKQLAFRNTTHGL